MALCWVTNRIGQHTFSDWEPKLSVASYDRSWTWDRLPVFVFLALVGNRQKKRGRKIFHFNSRGHMSSFQRFFVALAKTLLQKSLLPFSIVFISVFLSALLDYPLLPAVGSTLPPSYHSRTYRHSMNNTRLRTEYIAYRTDPDVQYSTVSTIVVRIDEWIFPEFVRQSWLRRQQASNKSRIRATVVVMHLHALTIRTI
jgi:hypothetical protein